jgi:hypothetical protein
MHFGTDRPAGQNVGDADQRPVLCKSMASEANDHEAIRELLAETRRTYAAAATALAKARELAMKSGIRLDGDDVINAQRINIVEPDGTLRLVISNRSRFPGVVLHGVETPHPNRNNVAGLVFYNGEATENGGLLWNGAHTPEGTEGSVHLSFDNYDQDQSLLVEAIDNGHDKRVQRIEFIDRPDWPLSELVGLSEREGRDYLATHDAPAIPRMRLARDEDGSVGLKLRDSDGRDRIILSVSAEGTPMLQMLDDNGYVVDQLPKPR